MTTAPNLGNLVGDVTRPIGHALGGLVKLFSGNPSTPTADAPETQAAASAVTTATTQLATAVQQSESAAEQLLQEGAVTLANDVLGKVPLVGALVEGPVDAEIVQAFPALWNEAGQVIAAKLSALVAAA